MSKNKYTAKREFYKSIQDLAEHPVVLEMKNIRSMGKQTAINIVSGWLIAITVSVKCFIWMRDLRRGQV